MFRRLVAPAAFALSALSRGTATDNYLNRHIGPTKEDTQDMLKAVGATNVFDMASSIFSKDVLRPEMAPVPAISESAALDRLRELGFKNKVVKNMIGQGFYECVVPPVILRNVLENPMWYTPYTPYQAEISQGRLESLLNFQTMVAGLTKMDYANASLLDQATSSAEAMYLCFNHHRQKRGTFFVSKDAFATTVEMVKTRAAPLNIKVVVGDVNEVDLSNPDLAGILVQSPDVKGEIHDFSALFTKAKENGVVCCCGTDLLADTLVKAPGEMGADVVVGTAQRLGTPLGYGGPHAGIFAFRDEFKRITPGRIVGISRDSNGELSIRMALQTREQHIKRERATSNICTAQALLANMNAFYGVYHGPEGLKQLASQIHSLTKVLAVGLESLGIKLVNKTYFDTITFAMPDPSEYAKGCEARGINVFVDKAAGTVSIAVDETTTEAHIKGLLEVAGMKTVNVAALSKVAETAAPIPQHLARSSAFMQEAVFSSYQSETELMRYIQRLQRKDYGLTHGMIPLGSCTMKLNPAASMRPLTWPEFGSIHPYAPAHQTQGYHEMLNGLEKWLCEVTGMAACSLQPNSGANGEYTGLRAIQAYHASKGEHSRKVCLIPTSAHGTNPASAVLAGLKVVTVKCTDEGRVDMADFETKCKKHAKELSSLMITYPSTYGLCDQDISKMTSLVHENGGQCYIDGANFNAVAGFSGPAFIGGDVMHLNLHKTFSIPHGGGGPGAGPIVVRQHLAPFLPNCAYDRSVGGKSSFGQVAQAGYGSASILTIPYTLFQMLGTQGVKTCTAYAVLNANYLKKRLEPHYEICFLGKHNLCAHEFILDLRPFKKTAHIEAEDVAKRLMDYGFHAPTLSFPVVGTLMIEPTESESKRELDRLADALISIRAEIAAIEKGDQPQENNLLKNAPHTAKMVMADEWSKPYSRQQAAFPSKYQLIEKYWPTVGRVDNTYGDRNLMCSCAPLEFYN